MLSSLICSIREQPLVDNTSRSRLQLLWKFLHVGCFVYHAFRFIQSRRGSGRGARLLGVMACLLIGIHLVAGYVCMSCTYPTEEPRVRSFHLHSGEDRNPCHHGRPEPNPLTAWACAVTQDDQAFVLPETPRLPILISVFLPFHEPISPSNNATLIAAVGRGPPSLYS